MSSEITIETLFKNLDKWRHFAGFPLEERVDPLIGLFLPVIIKDKFEEEIFPEIIPQFPLRKPSNNRSDKADFFVLSKDRETAFLIEIKTDMIYISDDQIKYLKRALTDGMGKILCGIKKIASANTRNRKKYLHLLYALYQLGLIGLSDDLKTNIRKVETTGTTKLIKEIEVYKSPKIKVVYIQPRPNDPGKIIDEFHYIYFREVADSIGSVENQTNLGRFLEQYIHRWKDTPGDISPNEFYNSHTDMTHP